MARGWESKSVEEQLAAAEENRNLRREPARTPEEQAAAAARGVLMLTRSRILQDLQAACNPARRAQLEAALAEIDERLASTS
jgi:hypothetical protein